jgi:UDP-N-acetylglucosamine 2-epimerase (hydrolysing)
MIGNSSAGVREAPAYGIPSIDIGTRQSNRVRSETVIHTDYRTQEILKAINRAKNIPYEIRRKAESPFGTGESDKRFFELLKKKEFWEIDIQKKFNDIL